MAEIADTMTTPNSVHTLSASLSRGCQGCRSPRIVRHSMKAAVILSLMLLSVMSMTAKDITYRELPNSTVTNMNRQRAFVASFAERHKLGLKVTRTKTDYDLLELILSKKLIKKDQAWELQALGVVFGDALISEGPKLRWMEVTDAWGTD